VDGDEAMDDEDYATMPQDQFSANGDANANLPIWNWMDYFLRIVSMRV
jgi:hypothetical protein